MNYSHKVGNLAPIACVEPTRSSPIKKRQLPIQPKINHLSGYAFRGVIFGLREKKIYITNLNMTELHCAMLFVKKGMDLFVLHHLY